MTRPRAERLAAAVLAICVRPRMGDDVHKQAEELRFAAKLLRRVAKLLDAKATSLLQDVARPLSAEVRWHFASLFRRPARRRRLSPVDEIMTELFGPLEEREHRRGCPVRAGCHDGACRCEAA